MENTKVVVVNGSHMLFNDSETISHEEVLRLLGIKDTKSFSVVYTKGRNNSKGGLSEGEKVEVVDFMRFNVDRTTNA